MFFFAKRALAPLPAFYARRTNTEKPNETPLPVSRGHQKPMLQRKNAVPEGTAFSL